VIESAPAAGSAYASCPRCHAIYPAGAKFCGRDRSELTPDERVFAGKYILLRKIGEGNMGEVYQAEQPQMARTVALKILRRDPEVMKRFEREVQAVGSIHHANVVTIYDSGLAEDGRGYIAMEYLEGESLTRHLEEHDKLPLPRALALWLQAVRAMAAAHAKGIVHRDLKPDNLFIARWQRDEGTEERVKVLDFGIAKFHQGAAKFQGTTPGMLIGTMQYMAPEQMESGATDPRTDVYALALILVEMLARRLPFGETQEQSYGLFALRLVREPTPLSLLCPEQRFSAELLKLVDDMLAKDAARRPASGSEILQRLRQVPEAQPILRGEGGSTLDGHNIPGVDAARMNAEGAARALTLAATQPLARPSSSALPRPSETALAQVTPSAPELAMPLRGRKILLLSLGLLGVMAIGGGYLIVTGKQKGSQAESDPKIRRPVVLPAVPDAGAPPLTKRVEGPDPVLPKTPHKPVIRAGTSEKPLAVQFAFADSKGLSLTCGTRRLPAPECIGGSLCKSNVTVLPGQRCVAVLNGLKKTFTYADLQKNTPDRKNLIHILVHFP
jgi:serine/threonine protein kinase